MRRSIYKVTDWITGNDDWKRYSAQMGPVLRNMNESRRLNQTRLEQYSQGMSLLKIEIIKARKQDNSILLRNLKYRYIQVEGDYLDLQKSDENLTNLLHWVKEFSRNFKHTNDMAKTSDIMTQSGCEYNMASIMQKLTSMQVASDSNNAINAMICGVTNKRSAERHESTTQSLDTNANTHGSRLERLDLEIQAAVDKEELQSIQYMPSVPLALKPPSIPLAIMPPTPTTTDKEDMKWMQLFDIPSIGPPVPPPASMPEIDEYEMNLRARLNKL